MTQIVDVMLAEADELHEEKQGTLSFEDCVGSVLPKHPASVAMELLKRYHVDLEEEAQTQGIRVLDEQEALRCMNFSDAPDLVHRQREMEMLVEILLRKEKANPLLIGEPGVGKSALVEALAVRIQQGEIDIIQLHRGSIIVFRGLIISSDNLLLGFPIYQFKQCPLYIEIPLTLEDNTAYRNIIDFQTVKCDIGIQNTTPHCRSHRCRTVGKATDAVSAPICDL